MILDIGPTSAAQGNAQVRRRLLLSSRPVSTACFDTVIRVVGVKIKTHLKEDLG